jgi:hypothetical protein
MLKKPPLFYLVYWKLITRPIIVIKNNLAIVSFPVFERLIEFRAFGMEIHSQTLKVKSGVSNRVPRVFTRGALTLEREKRFELSTSTLARWHSTS